MEGSRNLPIKSVEEVFQDFEGRREGLKKALTTDVEQLLQKCEPKKEDMCLYGLPDGSWEVCEPPQLVPPEYPDPMIGINFSNEGGITFNAWLETIAVHSDAWLISTAFYIGTAVGFTRIDRKKLFKKMNELPTLYEVVTGKREKLPIRSKKKQAKARKNVSSSSEQPKEDGKDDDDDNFCAVCGEQYVINEFWICCDVCEAWYHGHCVEITPSKAEHIEFYECPKCATKTKKGKAAW